MNKITMGIFLLFTHAFAFSGEFSELKGGSRPKMHRICGFVFVEKEHMAVNIKPIKRETLRSRKDNERYDACPYNVEVAYKNIPIRIDFSSDVVLQSLRNLDDDENVRLAFFSYDKNGWKAVGEDISIEKADITTHETEDTLVVSGVVRRKKLYSKEEDFCFSLNVIGENKYLTGAVCRPKKAELESLNAFFAKNLVISAKK